MKERDQHTVKTKHLCAMHLKVWPSVNPRYIEKSLHSFMFAATTSLPKENSHRSEHVGLIHPLIVCSGRGKQQILTQTKVQPGLQNLNIRSYQPRLTNNFEQRCSATLYLLKKKCLFGVFAQSKLSHIKSVKIWPRSKFLHVVREYLCLKNNNTGELKSALCLLFLKR